MWHWILVEASYIESTAIPGSSVPGHLSSPGPEHNWLEKQTLQSDRLLRLKRRYSAGRDANVHWPLDINCAASSAVPPAQWVHTHAPYTIRTGHGRKDKHKQTVLWHYSPLPELECRVEGTTPPNLNWTYASPHPSIRAEGPAEDIVWSGMELDSRGIWFVLLFLTSKSLENHESHFQVQG